MQSATSFDWGRAVRPARWVAVILSGVALVGWAVWSIVLVANGTVNLDVAQWIVWAALGVDFTIAFLRKGNGELLGGLVLVAGAAAMGVVSGFQGPALLAIPLIAIAGVLFVVCRRYTQEHLRIPHATA